MNDKATKIRCLEVKNWSDPEVYPGEVIADIQRTEGGWRILLVPKSIHPESLFEEKIEGEFGVEPHPSFKDHVL